ncbi:MAG: DUF642 domain-containing protein, partial [Thermoguttaceae bacterium]
TSFETPGLPANVFQYAPNGSPWQFSGTAGVCGNGSGFGNPGAPGGSQAAFLQNTGSISQSTYLAAGTYSLSFMAAQRSGQKHYQEFKVLVDGLQEGMVTPAGTAYAGYQTLNFTLTAGTHTIQFIGLNPLGGDNTAFIDGLSISLTVDSINDGSFEAPGLPASTFQYAPDGSSWQFVGGGGVCSNGSAFGNPNAPNGSQAAFLQNTGSMNQSVYLDAGTCSLSFLAAQRAAETHYQEFKVLVDNTTVATVTPASTAYAWYQTPDFTVTAGLHTIEFVGVNPLGGDNTAFIDEVQIG